MKDGDARLASLDELSREELLKLLKDTTKLFRATLRSIDDSNYPVPEVARKWWHKHQRRDGKQRKRFDK